MEKKRLLLITQEMEPYTEGNDISALVGKLPKFLQDNGYELRILMPRYGVVNERRHRLHEVVRLSGMNIIVDDDDYPLLIKVASLPNSRLQVYFLDNEEFFKRKQVFEDEEGKPFEDNAERMTFFCKGAIETVKKFGWAPDIVFCHGWMTSLIPLYLRTTYKTEPIFANAHTTHNTKKRAESVSSKRQPSITCQRKIWNRTATEKVSPCTRELRTSQMQSRWEVKPSTLFRNTCRFLKQNRFFLLHQSMTRCQLILNSSGT
jgi:glycogen synthase